MTLDCKVNSNVIVSIWYLFEFLLQVVIGLISFRVWINEFDSILRFEQRFDDIRMDEEIQKQYEKRGINKCPSSSHWVAKITLSSSHFVLKCFDINICSNDHLNDLWHRNCCCNSSWDLVFHCFQCIITIHEWMDDKVHVDHPSCCTWNITKDEPWEDQWCWVMNKM